MLCVCVCTFQERLCLLREGFFFRDDANCFAISEFLLARIVAVVAIAVWDRCCCLRKMQIHREAINLCDLMLCRMEEIDGIGHITTIGLYFETHFTAGIATPEVYCLASVCGPPTVVGDFLWQIEDSCC